MPVSTYSLFSEIVTMLFLMSSVSQAFVNHLCQMLLLAEMAIMNKGCLGQEGNEKKLLNVMTNSNM